MNDATTDQIDENALVQDVSDEMLEAAGTSGTERADKTYGGWFLIFC